MGEITIKIPQRIRRSFHIENQQYAEEILKDLERRSANVKSISVENADIQRLKELVSSYRNNPDSETQTAIETAKDWREKWNR